MKIYYAHHRWKYGTEIEIYEQNLIKATFQEAMVINPFKDVSAISYWLDKDTAYHPDDRFVMDQCLTKVASSDILVFSSVDGVIGRGVYEEILKAEILGKPVYYIYQDELTQGFSIVKKDKPVTDRIYAIVTSNHGLVSKKDFEKAFQKAVYEFIKEKENG